MSNPTTEARKESNQNRGRLTSLFLLVMGAVSLVGGITGLVGVVEAREVRAAWKQAEARVTHVHSGGVGSRGGQFLVDMVVVRPDGSSSQNRGPVLVPVRRSSWSDAAPPLAVGSVVAVFIDPREPSVMIAADSVTPAWMSVVYACLMASGVLLLAVVGHGAMNKLARRDRRPATD